MMLRNMRTRNIILVFFCILFFSGTVCAQDTSSRQEEKKRLEREIEIINKQLSDNASKSRDLIADLALIKKKASIKQQICDNCDKEIRLISDKIYQKQREINRLQERLDTLSEHYSNLILAAYKNRDTRLWYMYILASENLGQAYRRYAYFRSLSSQMNAEAEKIEALQAELASEKDKLAVLKNEAKSKKQEAAASLKELEAARKQADAASAKLKKDKKSYEQQIRKKREQIQAINKEIEKMLAESKRKQTSSKSGNKMSQEDIRLASDFSSNKGKLPWPAVGPVIVHFNNRIDASVDLPQSKGIEIALDKNSKVCAIFDGKVIGKSFIRGSGGVCIIIQHGNYYSCYGILKDVKLNVGDNVRTGQQLGTVVSMAGSTRLGFQLHKDNVNLNPEIWLRKP